MKATKNSQNYEFLSKLSTKFKFRDKTGVTNVNLITHDYAKYQLLNTKPFRVKRESILILES